MLIILANVFTPFQTDANCGNVSCALAKGNSACGKKEAKPCGTLDDTVA